MQLPCKFLLFESNLAFRVNCFLMWSLFKIRQHRVSTNHFEFRNLMQDVRDLLARVLCALYRPLHVLRQRLQHLHEDFLHYVDWHNYLSHALQTTILHHLWRPWGPVPSSQNIAACRNTSYLRDEHWMDSLAILLELFPVVGGYSVCTTNRNAPQNACRWEPYFALCRVPRTLPVLLHS